MQEKTVIFLEPGDAYELRRKVVQGAVAAYGLVVEKERILNGPHEYAWRDALSRLLYPTAVKNWRRGVAKRWHERQLAAFLLSGDDAIAKVVEFVGENRIPVARNRRTLRECIGAEAVRCPLDALGASLWIDLFFPKE